MQTRNHYLMHCRPRLEFHLGHIFALNHLYQLLVQGHRVTVLIIPFEEQEENNRTFRVRLQEDAQLTKNFYMNYLGFEQPYLNVVSTYEIEIPIADIDHAHKLFDDLYGNDESVRHLVEIHGRS
jgi:hypothetical protein